MTVLSNNVINPDDVAAHWLDVIEGMVKERVDYEGNPIEIDPEDGGGSIRIGWRRVRVVGAWSEVILQWFGVGEAWNEGDYRLPLTFDEDETVDDLGTTVEELLNEAVGYLEGWRADVPWDDLDHEIRVGLGGCRGAVEEIEVKGEGKCYRDEDGYVWSYVVDYERGYANIKAGLYDEEIGKVDWLEYSYLEGFDVLAGGVRWVVSHAMDDVWERLGE